MSAGFWSLSPFSNELGSYDVNTNRYTAINAIPGRHPPRLQAPDMVSVGRSLYIFGGQTHTFGYSSELWRFDLETTVWHALPAGAPSPSSAGGSVGPQLWPEARAYHRLAHSGSIADDRLFLFGGVKSVSVVPGELAAPRSVSSFFNDLWVYSVRTHRWSRVVPQSEAVPQRRSSHTMVCAANALWVYGGQNSRGALLDDLWRFSLDDYKWTKIETGLWRCVFFASSIFLPLHPPFSVSDLCL